MFKWCASAVLVVAAVACSASTPSVEKQISLEQSARATLSQMQSRDPGLAGITSASAGYVVFPSVGAAGALLVGGAFGKGILFEHGAATGYVELRQGSVGPQLGGQSYAELLVLRDPFDVQRLRAGKFDMGGNVSAVVLTAGAAAGTRFSGGTAVFVMPHGGLMGAIALNGQQLQFRPLTINAAG